MYEIDEKIIHLLLQQEMSSTQVCKALKISNSSFSHAMTRLRTKAFISVRKQGCRTYFKCLGRDIKLSTGAAEDPWGHLKVWGTRGIVDHRATTK
jgi:DNA-binding transcriptional ArsR family regulator